MLWLLLGCFLQKWSPLDTAYNGADLAPIFESCENTLQNHACDFSGTDSLGQKSNLYDFYKKPIVLDLSAMWCSPCQAAATEVEELSKIYEEDDLVYLTILIENRQGLPPSDDDVKWWLEEWGIIEAPVIASNRDLINNENAKEGWYLEGWPTFYFIDREMKIQGYLKGYSKDAIINGINQITEE